ncbi:hypothetical protein EGJ51_06945 [Pseudomonas fulva]|nr:hypothetical protein EGJ51_06945 [Pseudomonas fulva]
MSFIPDEIDLMIIFLRQCPLDDKPPQVFGMGIFFEQLQLPCFGVRRIQHAHFLGIFVIVKEKTHGFAANAQQQVISGMLDRQPWVLIRACKLD